MKTFFIIALLLNLGDAFTAEKNPCEKNNLSNDCKAFLKNITKDYPCATDMTKYCVPKEVTKLDDAKKMTLTDINKCLENNFSKLTSECQKTLESKKSSASCMDAALSKCSSLKGDDQINCMAEVQPKAISDCKKSSK